MSLSTVDRRIERGELQVEKELHRSRNRTWVVLGDEVPETSGEVSIGVSSEIPRESHLEEVITLRGRVESLEQPEQYHRDQLHKKALLV